MMLSLAYGIPAGVFGGWQSVLTVNLKPAGISQVSFDLPENTVKPAHGGQTRSQGNSTTRSRWLLRATETYEFFFPWNGNLC